MWVHTLHCTALYLRPLSEATALYLRPLSEANSRVDVPHEWQQAPNSSFKRRITTCGLAHSAVVGEISEQLQARVPRDSDSSIPGVEEQAAAMRFVVHRDADFDL